VLDDRARLPNFPGQKCWKKPQIKPFQIFVFCSYFYKSSLLKSVGSAKKVSCWVYSEPNQKISFQKPQDSSSEPIHL
jgi:hypothetical protein